jgi:hypothetical protein
VVRVKAIRDYRSNRMIWTRIDVDRPNYVLTSSDGKDTLATLRYDDPRAVGESGMIAQISEAVYSLSSQGWMLRTQIELRRLDSSFTKIGELISGDAKGTWKIRIEDGETQTLRREASGTYCLSAGASKPHWVIRPTSGNPPAMGSPLQGGSIEVSGGSLRFDDNLLLSIVICWYFIWRDSVEAPAVIA